MTRGIGRGGALAVLLALGLVAGCADDRDVDRAAARSGASASASPAEPSVPEPTEHRRISVDARPGTRDAAQRVLDRAEQRLTEVGRGGHTVDYELAGAATFSSRTRYVLSANRSETVYAIDPPGSDDDIAVTQRVIEGQLYTRPTIGGRTMRCWLHVDRPDLAAEGMSATTPPLSMLVQPRATGFLADVEDDPSYRQVVVDVLLVEAMGAAMPRVLGRIDTAPLDGETVPAVVTVAYGSYLSIVLELGDVVDGLRDAGVDIDDLARQAGLATSADGPYRLSRLLDALVTIDYEFTSTASDVERPDGRVVDVDTTDPDAPLPDGCRL